MKKLTVVLFIALVACSQSKEEKAKSLIKENMKTSMNDFKSYEAVEFGKLDSTYTSYHNDENYISLTGWEKQYKLNYKSWNDQSKEFDNDRQSLREI